MTLHPVHHVASVAVASCNCIFYINIRDVFLKLDAIEQVTVGTVAPVVPYSCIDVSVESPWLDVTNLLPYRVPTPGFR